jgi:hypothetical protein
VLLSLTALLAICIVLTSEHLRVSAQAPEASTAAPASDEGCPGNAVFNGDFRLKSTGWYTATTGMGWKKNPLIVCSASCRSDCCASFGSEGVWETVSQTVTIPAQGVLTYWWLMRTSEPERKPYDSLAVDLYTQAGSRVARLAYYHSGEEHPSWVWAQDIVDVSDYAGQTLVLQFAASNDNYYATTFFVDDVCLQAASPPVVPEASSLALMGLGAAGLISYIGLQLRARHGSSKHDKA